MNVLAELRRRNVIRMAGLYLVGAWLLVQVAETLLPIFDTPGWVLKTLVVLLAIGFIPALVFSWRFELTPEGLKRESVIDRSASIVDRTARKLDLEGAIPEARNDLIESLRALRIRRYPHDSLLQAIWSLRRNATACDAAHRPGAPARCDPGHPRRTSGARARHRRGGADALNLAHRPTQA